MIKLTHTKLVITGSIVEAYSYTDKPLAYGFTTPGRNKTRIKIVVVDEESKLRKLESRKRSMRRAGSRIRKMVNANAWQWKSAVGVPYEPIFATFTFKDDVRDVELANAHFSHFIRRLNYEVSGGSKKCLIKYMAVIEFQDLTRSGVVHYHAVFFNLPIETIALLSAIWDRGFVDIKPVDEIDNIGAYISKDASLGFDDVRLDERKRYFSSRGLLQPIEVREQRTARKIISLIPKEYVIRASSFNGHQGSVKCLRYKLKNDETLFDVVPELNNLL